MGSEEGILVPVCLGRHLCWFVRVALTAPNAPKLLVGCYWLRGVVFAGDGSDHKGRMGAEAFCSRYMIGDLEMKQNVVGREEEGTNRPELSAPVLALKESKTTDNTVRLGGMGTGISESSKRVSIFSFATQGGKQVSFYFRQGNWVPAREAQIRFPAG